MIDWKRISELKREIGDAEFDEVVELFIEEVDAVILRLKQEPNPELFEENLHFLKGCSVNLGFADLAALCLAGETMSSGGNAEKVELANVFDSYEMSKRVFFEGMKTESLASGIHSRRY